MNDNPVWEQLQAADPAAAARNSGAVYNPEGDIFLVPVFTTEVTVRRAERKITAASALGNRLLSEYGEYFTLAAPAYLVHADGRPLTGELIQPKKLSGGDIYRKGAHRLPLGRLAAKFDHDPAGFRRAVAELGGEEQEYGDVSGRLFPFPKVPVTIALWFSDDEFPERGDLFFDSSSNGQFPPDVLWGIASLCVELLLPVSPPSP